MTKHTRKTAVLWAFIVLFVTGLIVISTFFFPTKWSTLSQEDFTLKYPSGWSHAEISGGKMLLLSDYKGDLSIQDRSSPKEQVRLTITKISKKTVPSLVEAENKYNSSYGTSKKVRFITQVEGNTAVKLIIDNSSFQKNTFYSHIVVLLVDHGDNIYQIEGGIFPDVNTFKTKYYLKIIDKIIENLRFI